MKKIILLMMIFVTSVSFSWTYENHYSYHMEKNVQLIGSTKGEDFIITMADGDALSIATYFKKTTKPSVNVKIFVDKTKTYEGIAVHVGNGLYLTEMNRFNVEKFKKGKQAVIVLNDGTKSVMESISLIGFTKSFNKIKNVKYLSDYKN